jgi:hypothetical protein
LYAKEGEDGGVFMDKGGGIYIGNTAGYLSAWILISFLERIQDFY